jgi:hypothetical protein
MLASTSRAPAPDALAANPRFRVLPRSGKGFVVGGQGWAHKKPKAAS